MKFRRDITEYIWELRFGFESPFKFLPKETKHYKAYVSNCGLIYMANYFFENENKISHYSYYSLCGITEEMMEKVTNKFKVTFAAKDDRIICRCGKNKSFSAFYGGYELILKCEVCLNEFTAYSG